MLLDHDMRVEKQVGSWVRFELDDKGLFMEGRISKTPNTEHLIKLVEDGAINTTSIGGLMKYEGQNKKGQNRIVKIMLLETSIVTIPANEKAEFSQKSLAKPNQVDESKDKGLTKKEKIDETKKILKERGLI